LKNLDPIGERCQVTLTDRMAIERQSRGTASTLIPDGLVSAVLMAGLIPTAPVAASSEKPYTIEQNILSGTMHRLGADIVLQDDYKRQLDRAILVQKLLELRERSIHEGVELLTSDLISEEIKVRRGE